MGITLTERAAEHVQGFLSIRGKGLGLLPERVSTTVVAIGVKKNEAALKTAVNDALTQLEKSGQAEKIFFAWYGPQTRHQYSVRDFKFAEPAAR